MRASVVFILSFVCAGSFAQNTNDFSGNPALDKNWIMSLDNAKNQHNGIQKPTLNNLSLYSESTNSFTSKQNTIPEIKLPPLIPEFDYTRNYYSVIPINDKIFISTARINNNYIGLGGMSSAGANIHYFLNDKITFSGGATFSKFNIYNDFRNEVSFNGKLRFELTDRIFFNAFGNYAPQAVQNPNLFRSLDNSMFQQTNYGGAFEFKITEKWGIMTGAEREFDAFRGKWVTRPIISPVFYSK